MNIRHKKKNNEQLMLLELSINENDYEFASDIKTALSTAESKLDIVSTRLEEKLECLKKLTV